MGDGTHDNPYTREDVLRLIKENGGKAKGLDLSGKVFEQGIDLSKLNLAEITLSNAILFHPSYRGEKITYANLEGTNLMSANLQGIDLVCAKLGGAILSGAHLEHAKLWNAQLLEADLRGAHFESAVLTDANLEEADLGHAYLGGADLMGAKLEGADLVGVEIQHDTKLDNVYWGNYVLYRESCGEFYFVISTYRRLKMWYAAHGMHDIAAEFYYREKEATRKNLEWRSKSTFRHRLALEFFRVFFGYGEKWNRILIWMAAVVFGLAGAYHLWGSFSSSSFPNTLYYSATSFTALGYGHWVPQPTGWAKGVGVAEAFIGVFMMALLLVTFVRKWTR
jgi:hypothetical protein